MRTTQEIDLEIDRLNAERARLTGVPEHLAKRYHEVRSAIPHSTHEDALAVAQRQHDADEEAKRLAARKESAALEALRGLLPKVDAIAEAVRNAVKVTGN